MTKPSELSIAVHAFIKANHGVTVDEIATQLDAPKNKVKYAVDRLMRSEKIDSHAISRGIAARYTAAFKHPAMVQPMNGPGHTMRPLGKLAKPTSAPLRNSTTSGKYDGAELQRNAGIPDERFAAFALPSLVNGVRVNPTRITAMCVGAANGPVGNGQARRFA